MSKQVLKILIFVLPLPVIVTSLFVGPSENISVSDIFSFMVHSSSPVKLPLLKSIVLDVRLPRILLTFLVGGTLAVSGNALQAVFRNPLVSPYILGLSSGAAFGAALAMAVVFLPVQLSAFVFGMIATGMSYFMARKNKNVSIVSLILAGIIVSGIFTALLTIIQYLSDPFKLQTIVHWTMGNLHNANWNKLQSSFLPMTAGIIVLLLYRWRLNVLALGDDEAKSAGLNPDRDKIIILIAATLASSAAVAVSGIIGLFGLIVPHMVRMMSGNDNRSTMLQNLLFGGIFLLVIDDFSRTLTNFEIPIGVFTMLLGAPFFIYLMKKTSIGWE